MEREEKVRLMLMEIVILLLVRGNGNEV